MILPENIFIRITASATNVNKSQLHFTENLEILLLFC